MPEMHEIQYDFKVSAAPAVEPVTLAEAKEHIHPGLADASQDVYITKLIIGARQSAEFTTHRQIITATLLLTMDRFPDVIRLPAPPAQSVTTVSYVDTDGDTQTLVEDTDYQVELDSEPGRIAPFFNTDWPTTREQMGAVTVKWVAGYGAAADVPEGLKNAINYVIAQRFENREPTVIGTSAQKVPATLDFAFEPYIFREFR